MSTKHLCLIELHTSAAMRVLQPHPRARVWEEERHRRLPGWSLRPGYRLLEMPIRFLSARGSRPDRTPEA